nr:immunoglobulin light chain junction region [Macaca mulatta]MOV79038.1 immunoglobulin light chain junction region [Macaca mulatta]MOV79656.1 immunoglobulin light chain junction region [Macaca mulatta]MOV80095.1 immunoglobulin light chain junction region [Macaca mulatta]MOV80208.1 immunoglobulin light chain junction region [Macaca mulatta]
CLQYKSFPYSF